MVQKIDFALRKPIPFWKNAGWRSTKPDQYEGCYQTGDRSWRGKIVCGKNGTPLEYYIYDPPDQLEAHPHWRCFTDQGARKFKIHFYSKPKDISDGILEVQNLLREAMKTSTKKRGLFSFFGSTD